MKKAMFYLSCCIGIFNGINAQNLVSNGDFENYTALPNDITQWDKCVGWTNAGGTATPDYYLTTATGAAQLPNSYFGLVQPFSGNAIMGIATYGGNYEPEYREYISTQLTAPMVVGASYQVSFYVTNGEADLWSVFSTDHIGIRFSTSSLSQSGNSPINVVPQLQVSGEVWSNTWQQYTFTFVADAAYTHMTIGNFYNDASTSATFHASTIQNALPYAYYYFDKIEVIADQIIPTALISGATTICSGTSAELTISGTPNSTVIYTVNGGGQQTVSLGLSGVVVVNTGELSENATYQLVSVTLDNDPLSTVSLVSSATITVENPPLINFSADETSGCEDLTVSFTNLSQNSTQCSWDFGDGSTYSGCSDVTHTYNESGVYDVMLQASSLSGCTSVLSMEEMITVYPNPVAAFSYVADESGDVNQTIQFTNGSVNADAYEWTFGDNTMSNLVSPVHEYGESSVSEMIVTLTATNQYGCSDQVQSEIEMNELIYYVPNAFTPDGNKFNQIFAPVLTSGIDERDYNLLIFNRWGELVFETTDLREGWNGFYNGQLMNDGVYTWVMTFKLKATDEKKMKTGHVCLLK